jgi:hypothetical protein
MITFIGVIMRQPAYLERLSTLMRPDGRLRVYTEPFQLRYPNGVSVYDGRLEFRACRVDQTVVYRTRVDLTSTYRGPSYSEQYSFVAYPPRVLQFGQWRANERRIHHLDIPLYVFRLLRREFR